MRAQSRTSSVGHPRPAARNKRKAFKRKYMRRSTAAPARVPTVTTRARAARDAATSHTTAVATPAAATLATPAEAAVAAATHGRSQQYALGATTRSKAAANGIIIISSNSSTLARARSSESDVAGSQASASAVPRAVQTRSSAATADNDSGRSSSSNVEKTVTCGICLDDVSSSSMYRLGCRHSFCRSCLASHLKSCLQDRQLPAACPAAGCRRVVGQGHAWELLARTPRVLKKFLEATKEASTIVRGTAIYCPNSSCSKLVSIARLTPAAARGLSPAQKAAKQQQLAHVQCTHCSHDCCTSCRCSWHAGLSCAGYQALPASEKGEADLALFELSSSKHWRRCPSCRAMVERSDGCNYMMCRCGEPFCYACGASINTCYSSGCVAGMAAAGW